MATHNAGIYFLTINKAVDHTGVVFRLVEAGSNIVAHATVHREVTPNPIRGNVDVFDHSNFVHSHCRRPCNRAPRLYFHDEFWKPQFLAVPIHTTDQISGNGSNVKALLFLHIGDAVSSAEVQHAEVA